MRIADVAVAIIRNDYSVFYVDLYTSTSYGVCNEICFALNSHLHFLPSNWLKIHFAPEKGI